MAPFSAPHNSHRLIEGRPRFQSPLVFSHHLFLRYEYYTTFLPQGNITPPPSSSLWDPSNWIAFAAPSISVPPSYNPHRYPHYNGGGQTPLMGPSYNYGYHSAEWFIDQDTLIFNGTATSAMGRHYNGGHHYFEDSNGWIEEDDGIIIMDGAASAMPEINDDDQRGASLRKEAILKCIETRNCSKNADDGEQEDNICVVCQDQMNQENAVIGILQCRHEYHVSCILEWLQHKNNCPLCKAVAVEEH